METWKVSLFAYLRERHGDSLIIQAEPNVASIFKALSEAGVNTVACRLAVNEEFAVEATPVPSGSSLALIPPVSGG